MRAWIRPALGAVVTAMVSFAGASGVRGAPAGGTSGEPWKATCDRVKDIPFPATDQPDDAARKALAKCSAEELFYGIGQAADPEKARLCAYIERAAGDELVFGGSAILMTIYATGIGARRNPDLAIRLACGIEGAPAEVEYRVAHLEKLKPETGKRIAFSLCDDATSGFMMGHCAGHDQRVAAAKRDRRYAARLTTWTGPERAAFRKLREAAGAFFGSRSENEVDLSGTARAMLQIQEQEERETSFTALLDKLEHGAAPGTTASDLAGADRELNAVYQRVMKTEGKSAWGGTVTKDGIRETERKWPKYRDGWTDFVKVKFPKVDPTIVKTWLTRERTKMLKDFVPDVPTPIPSSKP